MKRNNIIGIVFFIILMASTLQINAQTNHHLAQNRLGFGVSMLDFSPNITALNRDSLHSPLFNFNYIRQLNKSFAVDFNYSAGSIQNLKTQRFYGNGSAFASKVMLGARYCFDNGYILPVDFRVSPYLSAGFGSAYINRMQDGRLSNFETRQYYYGGGLNIKISPQNSIQLQTTYHTNAKGQNLVHFQHQIGLIFCLHSSKKDTDRLFDKAFEEPTAAYPKTKEDMQNASIKTNIPTQNSASNTETKRKKIDRILENERINQQNTPQSTVVKGKKKDGQLMLFDKNFVEPKAVFPQKITNKNLDQTDEPTPTANNNFDAGKPKKEIKTAKNDPKAIYKPKTTLKNDTSQPNIDKNKTKNLILKGSSAIDTLANGQIVLKNSNIQLSFIKNSSVEEGFYVIVESTNTLQQAIRVQKNVKKNYAYNTAEIIAVRDNLYRIGIGCGLNGEQTEKAVYKIWREYNPDARLVYARK